MRVLIFLLIFIPLLSACNQTMLGAGHALKNAISLPLNGLRSLGNSISGENHRNYRERTLEANAEMSGQLYCADESPTPTEVTELSSLLSEMREATCRCATWGNCSAPLCPCATLCPNHYGIFDRPERQAIDFPEYENDLPFRNTAVDFANSRHPLTMGYCWGHTATHQQLFRLGFFKPDQPPPHEEGTREWADYYRDILNDLSSNKVREIPGFSSIREFTSHPTIQEFLINDIVPNSWASRAMSFEGTRAYLSRGRSPRPEEGQALVQEVQERINQFNVNPTILFRSKSRREAVHIVAVHEVIQKDDQTILCLTDSNYSALLNSNCLTTLTINPDGSMTYTGWPDEEIALAEVPSQENAELVSQAQSLRQYCEEQYENCPL